MYSFQKMIEKGFFIIALYFVTISISNQTWGDAFGIEMILLVATGLLVLFLPSVKSDVVPNEFRTFR